jgi:hypothetical protein
LQNTCKWRYLCVDAFPSISGDLPGLLHGCCTHLRTNEARQWYFLTPATGQKPLVIDLRGSKLLWFFLHICRQFMKHSSRIHSSLLVSIEHKFVLHCRSTELESEVTVHMPEARYSGEDGKSIQLEVDPDFVAVRTCLGRSLREDPVQRSAVPRLDAAVPILRLPQGGVLASPVNFCFFFVQVPDG